MIGRNGFQFAGDFGVLRDSVNTCIDTLGALLKYQDDIGRMQGEALDKAVRQAVVGPAA